MTRAPQMKRAKGARSPDHPAKAEAAPQSYAA